MDQSRLMAGLTKVTLKRHPSLIPLLMSIGGGALLAASYTLRLAIRNPDVSWNKVKNPEPWQHLGVNGQYKFVSIGMDYKDLKAPEGRPDI